MKYSYYISFICFLWILLFTNTLYSQPKILESPAPKWLRESTKKPVTPDLNEISDGYYFEQSEYQVNVEEQIRYYKYTKVMIDNSGAENAGQINITFDPQYQKLYMHEVNIIRGNQIIDQLKIANFKIIATETETARFIYNGTYSAYLILDDLRKDDKIVLSYSLKGFNPVFSNKFFDSYYLQFYEPIGVVHVSYIMPPSISLIFKSHQGAAEPKMELKNGYQYYSWEETNLPGYDYEDYEPSWYESHQWIECSEYKSWKEVGDWAKSVNGLAPIEKNSALRPFVDDLWRNAKSDINEYFRLAVDFVQNDVRYMGVEIGQHSHRANNPQKVFDQRYGDCKDKSLLLATILKDKGVDASLVLAHSYKYAGLDDELPSPRVFNHMVVKVNVDGRNQFIDPTMSNQGGNIRFRDFPYYGQVLVLDTPDKLEETPKSESGNTRIIEKFLLQKDGGAKLEVKTIYSGNKADNTRSYFASNSRKQIQKDYLSFYSDKYSSIVQEKPIKLVDNKIDNQIEVLEFYFIESDFATVEESSNKKYIAFYANSVADKFPDIKPNRKAPLSLEDPTTLDYTVLIVNPEGKSMDVASASVSFNDKAYFFTKSISSDKDTLRISYNIGIEQPYIEIADLANYYTKFKTKDQLLFTSYYLNEDGSVSNNNTLSPSGPLNYYAIAYSILLIIGLLSFIKYYNKTTPSSIILLSKESINIKIQGWLIVLAIALGITTLKLIYGIFSTGYFMQGLWDSYLNVPNLNKYNFWAVLIFEQTGNLIFLVGVVYSLYLMFHKRDLFPSTLLYLLIFVFVFVLLDAIAVKVFAPRLPVDTTFIRELYFPVIWGLYIYNSQLVKDTFVNPYYPIVEHDQFDEPSNDNKHEEVINDL